MKFGRDSSGRATVGVQRRVGLATALCALAFGLLAPTPAHAQFIQRFALHFEGGFGGMLPEYQQQTLRQGFVLEGTARLGFNFVDFLGIQVSGGQWFFPSTATGCNVGTPINECNFSGSVPVTGGLRIEPRIANLLRVFVDGNVGPVFTGPWIRLGFDAGLGVQFLVARGALGIGVFGRYAHVFHVEGLDRPSDAQYLAGGLSLSLRVPPPEERRVEPVVPPPPADTDHDGVLDPVDQCVTEPAGDHPDPARRGCPLRDTDHDTVLDPDDRCPTTPRGDHPDPERPGCPDGDDDNDTVLNHDDLCPQQHQTAMPDPARRGCPSPDRDHDGVPDATDHCPDQPGAPHPDPIRNGCPGLVRLDGNQIRIMTPVFFATNRDRILPRSIPVLTAVADVLRARPDIRRVSVEGHTDDVGVDQANMELSQRRADSVVRFLTEHTIAADRLEAHGFGETRALRSIDGLRRRALTAARAENRRVEFRIIETPAP